MVRFISLHELLRSPLNQHEAAKEAVVLSTGTANNAGAILVLGRDLVVVPKLIHPIPPAITSPESSPEHLEDTWMQVLILLYLPRLLQLACYMGLSVQSTISFSSFEVS